MNKFAISLIVAGFLLIPGLALAQEGGLGIIPSQIEGEESRSWFVYTLNKGESKEDSVVINNHSIKSKTIIIESLDAISTSNGGYSLVGGVDNNKDIGNWVNIEQTKVVLPPKESAEIKFSVTVPTTASVGEHNGGIVIYEERAGGGSDVKVVTRVAARMYITVPGKIEREIEIDEVSHVIQDGKLIFNIKGKNNSNIKLEPAIDIRLSGLLGSHKLEDNQNGTFLAGHKMDITKVWDRPAPFFGFYRVNVDMHTWTVEQTMPDGTVSELPNLDFSYSYNFWVGSFYFLWLIIALILLWLIYRIIVYLGDRSKYVLEMEMYTAKKGDTVMHIAERTGVYPKILVSINRLKWPYVVNPKDKILIPRGRLSTSKLNQKRISNPMPSFWIYLGSFKMSLYHPSPNKSDK